jgi:AcrR family transcriptional regulator
MNELSFLNSEPKQSRSRASFERVVEGTIRLLQERGADDFTLLEVSALTEVSIGSIYGRVSSKDDLIRIVQVRINEMLEKEHEAFLARAGRLGKDLPMLLDILINEMGEFLKRNAAIMSAIMCRAASDPVIKQAGQKSHAKLAKGFLDQVLAFRSQVIHPEPERAIDACFFVSYATLARYLGLGTEPTSTGGAEWSAVKNDLANMCISFLCSAPRIPAGRRRISR